ncbi:2,3-diphosphoglycerate-dependent phosphoglycerate mutase [Blochmannia endosymbiont of Camponotus sp. C-046]|uniref:2,3-diphosphoglycerate-dependent phosphoglycerate mutase n=1 Tax=Blochmannia endosymbiont of Camponotus sp. C-046 TaxID=2945589 RepID=UPI002024647B|nr:2,3-diphosphoglycerate-dependent phosphoglycerate mutase [Blochmannia endosymbiont of Camponotus sp. C-046]URJ28943.1 2,3-diphosphoglycerate-dependent phosphoglycerate mutase [Blochmannia endosymbiont of Camponotus sp. C-046]
MNITKLVLIRHGESQWNKENRFTGWVDVDLSDKGRAEAQYAGKILEKNRFFFNYGYTSVLKRAIHTLWIILDQLNQAWLPIEKSWRLNERHYGALQGLNKDEAIKKHGYETIQKWRRSFHIVPPRICENSQFIATNDHRYANLSADELPSSESLELTLQRVIPFWDQSIIPYIKQKKNIIIVAHGNSIRAIIKFLNHLNESEIFQINIPTGVPLIYEFDKDAYPIQHYYLK